MRRIEWRIIAAVIIFFLALAVRIVVIRYYPVDTLAGGDGKAFWSFAEGIAAGKGFVSTIEPWLADRPPLYSYFLAFVFLVAGRSSISVYYAQALLMAMSCGLFFLAANKLLGGIRGIFAGIICATLPTFLIFTKQTLTESIYPTLLILLVSILVLLNRNSIPLLILIGLNLGILSLTRREALVPAASIIAGYLFLLGESSFRQKAIHFGVVLAVAGITVSPWIIRNWIVLGRPVMSSSGGVNFMVGNNPSSDGSYAQPPEEWREQFGGLGELERDELAWTLSSSWIKEDPSRFFSQIPRKLRYLWGLTDSNFIDAFDLLLLPFYFFGISYLIKKHHSWKEILIIVLPLVLWVTLIGIVFVGWWRYRIAAYVGLILLAAFGIPDFIENWIHHLFSSSENEQHA